MKRLSIVTLTTFYITLVATDSNLNDGILSYIHYHHTIVGHVHKVTKEVTHLLSCGTQQTFCWR